MADCAFDVVWLKFEVIKFLSLKYCFVAQMPPELPSPDARDINKTISFSCLTIVGIIAGVCSFCVAFF